MTMEDNRKMKKGRLECEFSMDGMGGDFRLESKNYSVDGIRDSEFFIQAHYTGRNRNLQIIVCKTNSELIHTDISVSVTQDNNRKGKHIGEYILWRENYSCIFESVMLSSSNLKVICNIASSDSSETINPSTLPSDLHNDIKPFLLNSKLSDFRLIINGEELPVHKFVLGVQSSGFRSIFESDKGQRTNRLIIENISVKAMKNVLAYLYTKSIVALKNLQMALQMLIVARIYNIKTLEDLCECRLTEQITIWNALELFEKADVHNIKKLQAACFKFIVENKQPIINQPIFKTLLFKKSYLMYPLIMKWLSSEQQ